MLKLKTTTKKQNLTLVGPSHGTFKVLPNISANIITGALWETPAHPVENREEKSVSCVLLKRKEENREESHSI